MRRLTAGVVVLLSACSEDAALNLVISTPSQRPDTCFEVTVRTAGGEVVDDARFDREAGGGASLVIYQGTAFPDDVELQVQAWVADSGCAEPRVPNGLLTASAHFSKGITTVAARLETLADGDGDLAVALSSGGADCDDAAPLRTPFATEDCTQALDLDCDGFGRCSDSECEPECHGVASALSFTNPPLTVRQGDCSAALVLEARDPFGAPAALLSGLSLSGPGVTFYGDLNCANPAPTAVPMGGVSVYARATQAGTVTLTAAAAGVTSATQPLEVAPLPRLALPLATPPFTATGCITQAVQLMEADGGPYASAAPVVVGVSSGGAPMTLFDDCNARQVVPNVTVTGASGAFGFSTSRAGPLTLTASATDFTDGTVTYFVGAGPAYAAQLDAGDPLFAATCNPVSVRWTDDAGNPATPSPVQVTSSLPVFSDEKCEDAGVGASASTMTVYVWPGDRGTYPLAVDAGGVSAATSLRVVRPFPAGAQLELPIVVQTGNNRPFNGYDGYSVLAYADAGTAQNEPDLLRVYFWGDAGWRELDRLVGDFNPQLKQVWFKSQTDLTDSTNDDHYSFFVMPPASTPAKGSPHNVWLFSEDFEGGLTRWTDGGAHWVISSDGGHYSQRTLLNPGNDSGVEQTIAPLIPLSERDVSFHAWWRSPNYAAVDVGQQLRVQQTDGGPSWFAHEVGGGAWRTATYRTNGTYDKLNDINSGVAGPVDNGWGLVLARMCTDDLYGKTPGGERLSSNLNPEFGAGTIGFRASFLTAAPVEIDNVVVRRFACPEPTTSVLAPRTAP